MDQMYLGRTTNHIVTHTGGHYKLYYGLNRL